MWYISHSGFYILHRSCHAVCICIFCMDFYRNTCFFLNSCVMCVYFVSLAVVGLLYPCLDSHLGEPHKFKREWASVMRCIAVFVGINHASAVSSPTPVLFSVIISIHPEHSFKRAKYVVVYQNLFVNIQCCIAFINARMSPGNCNPTKLGTSEDELWYKTYLLFFNSCHLTETGLCQQHAAVSDASCFVPGAVVDVWPIKEWLWLGPDHCSPGYTCCSVVGLQRHLSVSYDCQCRW